MKSGAACLWTVQRCREQAAASRVKELCEVGSRAELDRDAAAQARWDERIRRAYLNYQQNHTNHNK